MLDDRRNLAPQGSTQAIQLIQCDAGEFSSLCPLLDAIKVARIPSTEFRKLSI